MHLKEKNNEKFSHDTAVFPHVRHSFKYLLCKHKQAGFSVMQISQNRVAFLGHTRTRLNDLIIYVSI